MLPAGTLDASHRAAVFDLLAACVPLDEAQLPELAELARSRGRS